MTAVPRVLSGDSMRQGEGLFCFWVEQPHGGRLQLLLDGRKYEHVSQVEIRAPGRGLPPPSS